MVGLLTRVGRLVIPISAVTALLVLVGATYQGASTALERRQFPHPGRLIDVGGHQLHIYCSGIGTPTVVLEAPATGMSAAWGWVQPEVAQITRVCSYDRAGLGWSESGDRGYDPAVVPSELHMLLERAGERAPYVVAGQGLGAAFATMYAARFGADVAAVVLVDPPAAELPRQDEVTRLVNASPWLARSGFLRATRIMSNNAAGLPDIAAGPLTSFLNRPDHLSRAGIELARWDETVTLAAGSTLAPAVPLTRVEASGPARTALLTSHERSAAVVEAIGTVVRQVRVTR